MVDYSLNCGNDSFTSEQALSLIKRLIKVDPETRLSASKALNDDWFSAND